MNLPMTWQRFAKMLFQLEDADPGYMMLARVDWSVPQKQRFMAGWCAFYNPGIAAKASMYRGHEFWEYLRTQYPIAKRASERRHFRGAAGLRAINSWEQKFVNPERMVLHMQGDTYFDVKNAAKTVVQIGEYFVWKFADVQERVFRIPCHFAPEAAKYSPKVPQQGAKLIDFKKTVGETYDMISDYLNAARMKAPPWYDRPMNMQEAETVACVYKQYRHGKWCPFSRTAKATRSLLATPSEAGEQILLALHQETGIQRGGMQAWQQQVLDSL